MAHQAPQGPSPQNGRGGAAGAASSFEPIFVARQPILDRQKVVWGYEILFRHSLTATSAHIADGDVATSKVIADGLSLVQPGIGPDRKVFINFPRNLLLGGAPYALPPESCIVELLETIQPEPAVLEACVALKEAGYTLALDDFVGQKGFEPLCELADIVKVDVLGKSTFDLAGIAAGLKRFGCRLLAEKVEDHATFKRTRAMGFELFQGYFFSFPEVIPGKKISTSEASKLNLLHELGTDSFDLKKLVEIIAVDISLSYRLLRYINSAAMGVRHTVTSIQQAIVILGQRQLSQWLRVVLLSDLDPSPQALPLAQLSVQRARFLELLARRVQRPDASPDGMFILGLFSLLDTILHQSMDEVLALLPLKDAVKDALQGKPVPARSWLELVHAWERGDWESVRSVLASTSVKPADAARDYAESIAWADAILAAPSAA